MNYEEGQQVLEAIGRQGTIKGDIASAPFLDLMREWAAAKKYKQISEAASYHRARFPGSGMYVASAIVDYVVKAMPLPPEQATKFRHKGMHLEPWALDLADAVYSPRRFTSLIESIEREGT